jgi:hypothetical protein
MVYALLLLFGSFMFIFGLLKAAHPPFQKWWYNTEWYNPKKKSSDVNSDEYKNAISNMRIAGSRGMFIGGLLVIYALSQLGLLD